MLSQEKLKENVAKEVFSFIIKNISKNKFMTLGIGSGSTVKIFIDLLGEWYENNDINYKIQTISSSIDSEKRCRYWKLPIYQLEDLEKNKKLDYYIDGADEVDSKKRSLKGLGGASTREKIIRLETSLFIIMVDESKRVSNLASKTPIVCEILPFGFEKTIERLEKIKPTPLKITLRKGSCKMGPVISDNGNYLVDLFFEEKFKNDLDLVELESTLKLIPGVIETGLFSKPADIVFISTQNGITILE